VVRQRGQRGQRGQRAGDALVSVAASRKLASPWGGMMVQACAAANMPKTSAAALKKKAWRGAFFYFQVSFAMEIRSTRMKGIFQLRGSLHNYETA
jgi:hypothetical protein